MSRILSVLADRMAEQSKGGDEEVSSIMLFYNTNQCYLKIQNAKCI